MNNLSIDWLNDYSIDWLIIIITTIIDFYPDTHHGQMSQEPFLSGVMVGLIHSYYKRRYIDCSVPKWTIPRGNS